MEKPMNPISDRLSRIILFKELSIAAFSDKINRSRQTVGNMLHRKEYSKDIYDLVIRMYPDVSEKWIRTGQGCPFRCDPHETEQTNEKKMLKQLAEEQRGLLEHYKNIVDELTKKLFSASSE